MDFTNRYTKKQIKTRLIIAFVIGIICLLLMILINKGEDISVIALILSPFLMTWSCLTLILDFKGYLENALKPWFKMFLYVCTLQFGLAFKCMFQPFVWMAKTLVYSAKAVFWAFSGEEG